MTIAMVTNLKLNWIHCC